MSALRRWWPFGLIVVLVVGLAVVAGPRRDSGIPLDPRSTGPLGTRAVLDVLRELGVEVDLDVGLPDAEHDVALLLHDALDDRARAALRGWVRDGGRVVVADPLSELTPDVVGSTAIAFTDPTLAPQCELAVLRGVGRIDGSGGALYDPAGGTACFPRGEGAWMVVREEGAGHVVALGGPTPLLNGALGGADNAVLAAALLGGDGPGSRLAVLRADTVGGTRTIRELLPRGVVPALWQLVLAFVLVAWWRARRVGRPVLEPLPVVLAGSETVRAGGRLLERAGARAHAAVVLRDDLRRALCERLGLPADAARDPRLVAEAAAVRTGVPAERIAAALVGPDPATDDQLARIAAEVAAVRAACLTAGARG